MAQKVSELMTSAPVSLSSGQPLTVAPNGDADTVVQRMRERRVRRVPVVDGGRPVGVVSIGDMAIERDERSALADISAETPNT